MESKSGFPSWFGPDSRCRLDTRRLVFGDKTWVETNMTRGHGRCAKRPSFEAHVDQSHALVPTFRIE
jgi:hypothetical protein